jgi:hypothetical protein
MGDWIGLGIIILVVICGLVGLSHLGKPYDVDSRGVRTTRT